MSVPTRSPLPNSSALDAALEEGMRRFSVPGAAAGIVQDDEVVYLKGLGVRELGRPKPVTPDTLFAIASTTKAFTTTSMAMLVDEGKMAWDDPVRRHIPSFRVDDPLTDALITLRDTVCHRTGMARHDALWYLSPMRSEEMVRRLGLLKPAYPIRTTYEYQNLMFLVAGLAVAGAAGMTWQDFVRARIFKPLGMAGANFSATDAQAAADHATPHYRWADDHTTAIPWCDIDALAPAGGINAGARDMAQWVRFQLGDGAFNGARLVSPEALAETHTPHTVIRRTESVRQGFPNTNLQSYGLGWVISDYRGRLNVAHGGELDGFTSQVSLFPNERFGLVVLNNTESVFPSAMANALADIVLNAPRTDWFAVHAGLMREGQAAREKARAEREAKRALGTSPTLDLSAYAGSYEDAAYGPARVEAASGALTLFWNGRAFPLEHFDYDAFTIRLNERFSLNNEEVAFALAPDHSVGALRFLGRDFPRKAAAPASE
ncbi:MAG TPA: serine hydrolase [Armatimonadota bacterium]|jgi:CubicO group peptidase (beta-lactamase class C family)